MPKTTIAGSVDIQGGAKPQRQVRARVSDGFVNPEAAPDVAGGDTGKALQMLSDSIARVGVQSEQEKIRKQMDNIEVTSEVIQQEIDDGTIKSVQENKLFLSHTENGRISIARALARKEAEAAENEIFDILTDDPSIMRDADRLEEVFSKYDTSITGTDSVDINKSARKSLLLTNTFDTIRQQSRTQRASDDRKLAIHEEGQQVSDILMGTPVEDVWGILADRDKEISSTSPLGNIERNNAAIDQVIAHAWSTGDTSILEQKIPAIYDSRLVQNELNKARHGIIKKAREEADYENRMKERARVQEDRDTAQKQHEELIAGTLDANDYKGTRYHAAALAMLDGDSRSTSQSNTVRERLSNQLRKAILTESVDGLDGLKNLDQDEINIWLNSQPLKASDREQLRQELPKLFDTSALIGNQSEEYVALQADITGFVADRFELVIGEAGIAQVTQNAVDSLESRIVADVVAYIDENGKRPEGKHLRSIFREVREDLEDDINRRAKLLKGRKATDPTPPEDVVGELSTEAMQAERDKEREAFIEAGRIAEEAAVAYRNETKDQVRHLTQWIEKIKAETPKGLAHKRARKDRLNKKERELADKEAELDSLFDEFSKNILEN